MKSKSDVYHDGLNISSDDVRATSSLTLLLRWEEIVYSDVMDMELKENEINFKIENADYEERDDLKGGLGKLRYKKQLYNILWEQIKKRIEIVKLSNYMEECEIFREIAKEYFSLKLFNEISEKAEKKFNEQTI